MLPNDYYFEPEEEAEESYPDFFYKWDQFLSNGQSVGYYESEDLSEIIEIYLDSNELEKAKKTIDYALETYPDDDDLIYGILSLLNDYELWNDLLILSEHYQYLPEVWADGHRITALLHLGMEEDAFHFFGKMKTKYAENEDNLSIIYQAMAESLAEMDLFEAAINVMDEALEVFGENADFYWIQLHSWIAAGCKEEAEIIAERIASLSAFDGETWHRLGIMYFDLDEIVKAIDSFEFARNLGFGTKENLLNLIQSYEQNSNYEKALEIAKEYINLYPDAHLIYIIASNISSLLERWKEAIGFLDQAIQRIPSLDSLYLCKSNYYLQLGEQGKAKSALKEGIMQTQDPEGHLREELEKLNDQDPEN
ncbi:MAG: tetratricopeptide repeat protein [Dysgonamonadaceae bacterium]|jgi:tetratricopeptide (TPR) repeat protein|nr:tetratricopeptide repeat protein [Dysgonamonadaceae bacterium]